MIESIFVFESTRSRQREAPLFREREQYLSYMLDQGVSKQRLRTIASMLLHVIRLMELTGPRVVDSAEIQEASQRWLKDTAHKMRRPGESSVESFTYAARNWLGFHNLIETPPACRTPDDVAVGEFVHFLTVTRGYSLETVSGYMARVRYFLKWATNRHEHLSMISLIDVDAFLSIKRTEGCRARTIASYCVALRMFFRYSEMRGWSEGRIASGIISPRISRYDGASTGPPWKDIRRMLNAGPTTDPAELRARAIFSLCSIYALRRSEVVNLTLDDFDWENETFTVRRVKRGRVQQFPIQFEVGEIILRYLQLGRPRCTCRRLFVTLRPPFRPVIASTLWIIIGGRLKRMGITSDHYGAHSLRHACATRLLSKGSSLRDIADFLGHRDMKSVSIYAKFDMRSLRQVATFSLAGVK